MLDDITVTPCHHFQIHVSQTCVSSFYNTLHTKVWFYVYFMSKKLTTQPLSSKTFQNFRKCTNFNLIIRLSHSTFYIQNDHIIIWEVKEINTPCSMFFQITCADILQSVIEFYLFVSRNKELQLTQKKNHIASRKMMDRWLFAMKVVNFRKKARMNWSRRCTR